MAGGATPKDAEAAADDAGQSCPAGSLAETRGANWAVPTGAPRATAYVRPIRVTFSAAGLNIAAGQGTSFVTADPDGVVMTDDLVVNIQREIERWGIAGARAYWKPELRVTVEPGGETNFERVRRLLQGSGVAIEGGQP